MELRMTLPAECDEIFVMLIPEIHVRLVMDLETLRFRAERTLFSCSFQGILACPLPMLGSQIALIWGGTLVPGNLFQLRQDIDLEMLDRAQVIRFNVRIVREAFP